MSLLALAGFFWVTGVHSFLAPTQRLQTNILVVEGWVPPYVIRAAAEFRSGHYEKIYTTGGPVVGNGGYLNDYNTSASVGAELLVKAGMPPIWCRWCRRMFPARPHLQFGRGVAGMVSRAKCGGDKF